MRNLLLIIILSLLQLSAARADVLVLVHGYASNAATWEYSGVNRVLVSNGWRPAGSSAATEKTFYLAQLPAKAPLMFQTRVLLNLLQDVRTRHPNEALTLVGHSAGGVVARLAVLQGNPAGVTRLVTIASPHLGTPRAAQGLDVAEDKPFFCPGPGWYAMKSIVGGSTYRYLRDSRGALRDMLPPGHLNLVNWANQQPHPDIRYHAVVRQYGDELVPALSQDLNMVPTLKGKARVWLSRSGHALNIHDGELLLNILAD
ncbi:MAG: alpha/beta hydrolase [Gammaproteobacteria bacterium]|nr:alpha/beta hydrolase [Gammaproteobacteria bacterium]